MKHRITAFMAAAILALAPLTACQSSAPAPSSPASSAGPVSSAVPAPSNTGSAVPAGKLTYFRSTACCPI